MKIKNFKGFTGQHCETTATGSLLRHLGIELSEPMLFGLGEGLSYIFWNMKMMDFPFIGGRNKPDELTKNICKNLKLKLEVNETSSSKKAWQNVTKYLENEIPVGLKLDCYHLDYFTNKIHFAGHYVAIYGFDSSNAYLIDTEQQGGRVKTKLGNLELARKEKGPMSSRNLSYTIHKNSSSINFEKAVKSAIKNNAVEYLNPPIKNISYKGILKTSKEIKNWFRSSNNIERDFTSTAMLMEKAGTGGAIFRNIYRDFLKESFELLQIDEIEESHLSFIAIANLWTDVSRLFTIIGETKKEEYVNQVSELLTEISMQEKKAIELLTKL